MNALLINPYIFDFTAYDFWVKPLGLLKLARVLKRNNISVRFLDCLDRFTSKKNYSTGKYYKTELPKTGILKKIPRKYSAYGIPFESFNVKLNSQAVPDAVFIAGGLTYRYPGVFYVINEVRKRFGGVPVIIGGIYPTLCGSHAKECSGADIVVEGKAGKSIGSILKEIYSIEPDIRGEDLLYPDYSLYPDLESASLSTISGCPFSCDYCASAYLAGEVSRLDPDTTASYIIDLIKEKGVKDIAFYDDALFFRANEHVNIILEKIIKSGVRAFFHASNAVHARYIDKTAAELMKKAGFKTVRIGLESADDAFNLSTGGKVNRDDFVRAAANLRKAGFSGDETGAYILCGLPGMNIAEIKKTVDFSCENGIRPYIAEFSPVPHTKMYDEITGKLGISLEEPLHHGREVFLRLLGETNREEIEALKRYAKSAGTNSSLCATVC